MKQFGKRLSLALAAVLLLCAVCGLWQTPAAAADGAFSPDGSLLFDREGIRVVTAGLGVDPTDADGQALVWLEIENTGSRDLWLGVTEGAVNGFAGDVLFVTFYEEDGEIWGADYSFSLLVPAGGGGRYALGYYKQDIPGVEMDTLGELSFRFTLAEDEYAWPEIASEPVRIVTGEPVEPADIASLGTVVIDNDSLRLVLGAQDYDDWFGPQVYLYLENRTEHYIALMADTAEADGAFCDYLYYYEAVAPGGLSAGVMSFDGAIRALKGFEKLTVNFRFAEAATRDELGEQEGQPLAPVTVQYPPQNWGVYENGGLCLEIRPTYNELVTVETPESSEHGILFNVSETASREAGGYEGAGWLFSVGRIGEEKLHEMLCYDMSGARVFAKDADGMYYLFCRPTDVRYERADAEAMARDAAQWSMLNEWAETVPDSLSRQYDLAYAAFGNTEVDIAVARAAWMDGVNATLSTTEYGPVPVEGTDGTAWAEFVMQGWFMWADPAETPDGEYVVLNLPDEETRLDFFFAPGNYVRVVHGDYESLYQAMWSDENFSFAEAMQGWYYAAAEQAGLREADESLAAFCGDWYETVAGRGRLTIASSLAPGKLRIEAVWPESASVENSWSFVAALGEDGRLCYQSGEKTVTEYGEDGESWVVDWSYDESGYFSLNDAGALVWHDDAAASGEDSVFSRSEPVPAPDYGEAENWAYFETDAERDADVFLICPTVDTRGERNALELNDKLKGRFLYALDLERGIFEETGRLFSPYYRQMSINAYTLPEAEREQAMQLAYGDVSAAFRWYLDNVNDGRGIILAGFSQGGEMCLELMKEYFGDAALRERLIAVYSIGWMLTEEDAAAYPQLVRASGETDTGSVVCFDCEDGTLSETIIIPAGMKPLSINPLNWRTDGTVADSSLNRGAVFEAGGEPIPALCGAYIGERGELVVTDVTAADYPPGLDIFPEGAFHLYDYMFFFENLRENVAARTAAWLAARSGGALEEIRARGVLRVGTAGDYMPMSYLDPETGAYVGFDAELAADLAEALGVGLEFVPTSWPTLMADTLAGSFDLAICGITITEARQEQALMSEGYLPNGKTVLCRAEDAEKYGSLEAIDRPEVRVMENPGGLNEKFAREKLPHATLLIHDVNQEIPGLVAAGEADVMITEIMEAGYYVGQDSRLAAPLLDAPFTHGELGVLLPKGSEDLLNYVNLFLESERASGRLDELAEAYIYGQAETLEPAA